MQLKEIMNRLEKLAPLELCESWDNVGLMVGSSSQEVKKCYVVLDINDAVIDYAVECGCDLIITHHPFLMTGLKSVNLEEPKGAQLSRLICNGISVYSMHTNFDSCIGGVNDILCETLGLLDYEEDQEQMWRKGKLASEMPLSDFVKLVKEKLDVSYVNCTGDLTREIRTVGVLGGAGGGFCSAMTDCDVYLTGEAKYHEYQEAQALGLCLVTAGHFETEAPALEKIRKMLSDLGLEVVEKEVYRGFYRTV